MHLKRLNFFCSFSSLYVFLTPPPIYLLHPPSSPRHQSPQKACPSSWVTPKTSSSAWTLSSPPTAACLWSWRPQRRAPPSRSTMWPARSSLPSKTVKSPTASAREPPGAPWPEICSLTSGKALGCPTQRPWRPRRLVCVEHLMLKWLFIKHLCSNAGVSVSRSPNPDVILRAPGSWAQPTHYLKQKHKVYVKESW